MSIGGSHNRAWSAVVGRSRGRHDIGRLSLIGSSLCGNVGGLLRCIAQGRHSHMQAAIGVDLVTRGLHSRLESYEHSKPNAACRG
jgi:hypothetical protein